MTRDITDQASLSEPLQAVVDRIRTTYSRWNRHTSVEQMRGDWDALFWRNDVACEYLDADANGVAVRWIAAEGVNRERVLMYFHGGGYKMGSVVSHHDLMARLSQAADCQVVGVNYRLQPEFAFPAPVEDALAVYRFLLAEGYPATALAVAGDSAGGGLAAAALLAIRDQQLPMPAAAVLLSAWLDLEANAASYETRAAVDPIHQRPMILALAEQYLGKQGDRRNPLASPLYGDLTGLPSLLLQVGDCETGLDDSVDFADKARRMGVPVELSVWDDMIHVFQQFAQDLPEARQAIRETGDFLKQQWSGS